MIYRFGPCDLDPSRHLLLRDGAAVHVEPQVFQLLELLVSRRGDLVTRDEIVDAVWQGRIVSEAAISSRINAARAAVGDDGRRQGIIRTVTRRGLQLAVPVDCIETTHDVIPPAPPQREQRIRMTRSRDGAGIAWAASGDGPPLLRAGHWLSHLELDWDSPVWAPLLDRLGNGRRLIRYDQRGTGLSDRNAPAPTLDALTDDLESVAEAAGLDRFAIYAVSQSVPVAVNFTARWPERVSSLVLHAGFVRGSHIREAETGEDMTDTFLQLIRNGWGKPGSAFMTALASLFMPGATPAQMASMIEMQLASASAETAAKLRDAIGGFDVSDRLKSITCPTLICHGRDDAVQPFSEGQRLAKEIAGAEFIALDSPAHVLLPQDPAWTKMLDAVDRFLAETPGP